MDNNTTTLGGFEAIIDSFIPNGSKNLEDAFNITDDVINDEPLTDEELDAIKNKKSANDKTVVDEPESDDDLEDDIDDEDEPEPTPKRKPGRPKKEDTIIEEPEETDTDEFDESNIVTNFFDAISEELGWEEEDDNKPKDVAGLISYFKDVIEENSKPEYSSEEVEALDNFVKQGGDIREYLQIETELNLDDIDTEDEYNQRLIVKQLLKEKGFNDKRIDKMITKYEESGILEDEAKDAIEDLKEIRDQKKEQLLREQEKLYNQQIERQQQFYTNVVSEIKGLKNIRGINIPEKDKKVLMDYILKPDADGRTKYQKDYAKGGVKNLIESAYFTMNADKLLEAAKREGNNSAIEKFKKSLRSSSVNGKSKSVHTSDDNDSIWFSAAHKLRMS